VKSVEPITRVEEVEFLWFTYRVPRASVEEVSTLLAAHLGGCIIPVGVSIYLLYLHPNLLPTATLGILGTAVVVHLVARRVPGLGIVTPAFIPPWYLLGSTPQTLNRGLAKLVRGAEE